MSGFSRNDLWVGFVSNCMKHWITVRSWDLENRWYFTDGDSREAFWRVESRGLQRSEGPGGAALLALGPRAARRPAGVTPGHWLRVTSAGSSSAGRANRRPRPWVLARAAPGAQLLIGLHLCLGAELSSALAKSLLCETCRSEVLELVTTLTRRVFAEPHGRQIVPNGRPGEQWV